MIYLFWGDNHYAKEAKILELAKQHSDKHGEVEIERLDGEEIDEQMLQNLTAQSLFSTHRFVVVRDISMNKKVVQQVTEVLGRIPDDTDLVFSELKVKKNTTFYKQLLKAGEAHEFKALSEGELSAWVAQKVEELGGKISRSNASLLVGRVGTNQMILVNEISKLLAYDPNITNETIELLVEKKPEENIFELLDNVARGDVKRARGLYRDLRRAQAEPHYVMSMIGWQLNNIATVVASEGKTAQQIAADSGLSPYVAQKTLRLTRNMSLQQVIKMVDYAAEADLALKTTAAQPDQLVEQLIDRLGELAAD